MQQQDVFLCVQRASARLSTLLDDLRTVLGPLAACAAGAATDLYYRRPTDVALVGLHIDAHHIAPAMLAAFEGRAQRFKIEVLEPGRLPEGERQRFFAHYLPQYEVRALRLADLAAAVTCLGEHVAGHGARGASERGVAAGGPGGARPGPSGGLPTQPPSGPRLEVRFRRGDHWQLGRIRTYSREGIYVWTGAPPRRGDLVELALAYGPTQLLVRSRVSDVTPPGGAAETPPGFAAQYLVGDAAEAERVSRFMAHVRSAVPTELRPPPKRREARYPVNWPVVVAGTAGRAQTSVLDLSMHGMFVAVPVADGTQPGHAVEVTLPMDDGTEPVRAAARVARAVGPSLARQRGMPTGLGLTFDTLPPRDQTRFSRFCARVARRSSLSILVGAEHEKAAAIVQELVAAGYMAAQVEDPATLLARASAQRPPDLVLFDRSVTRGDMRMEGALRRALGVRQIPIQNVGDENARETRAAVDMALLN